MSQDDLIPVLLGFMLNIIASFAFIGIQRYWRKHQLKSKEKRALIEQKADLVAQDPIWELRWRIHQEGFEVRNLLFAVGTYVTASAFFVLYGILNPASPLNNYSLIALAILMALNFLTGMGAAQLQKGDLRNAILDELTRRRGFDIPSGSLEETKAAGE